MHLVNLRETSLLHHVLKIIKGECPEEALAPELLRMPLMFANIFKAVCYNKASETFAGLAENGDWAMARQ